MVFVFILCNLSAAWLQCLGRNSLQPIWGQIIQLSQTCIDSLLMMRMEKVWKSRDNCLNICLVRSGIAHRFLRRPEIITSPPPRDGDNQGRPAPLIWTGLMTPPQPWFAANVSIENIDTIVITVKVNNGRKITDVNFGIKTPITIDTIIYDNTKCCWKRWTKTAAKIKTLRPF